MRMQKLYGIALVAILAFGVASCGLFDSRDPVGPVDSIVDTTQLANFWVKDGPGGKYEVSTQEGEMEVSVPDEGQYMLTYKTMHGTFYIVFETQDAATLVIGLQAGDVVDMAYIQDGEILKTEDLTIIVQTDILTAYLLPGTDDDDADNDADDADDEIPSEWYDMFDGGFMLIMLILDGEIVLEDDNDDNDDTDDPADPDDPGDGPPWTVGVTSEGDGTVKPGGEQTVQDGASISIQFLPDSGNFSDISVTIITTDEAGGEVEEDFTQYLQQLGGKPGKQKGHLVIHGVDRNMKIEATFSNSGSDDGGQPDKPNKPKK